jgi:hypothetical protein
MLTDLLLSAFIRENNKEQGGKTTNRKKRQKLLRMRNVKFGM